MGPVSERAGRYQRSFSGLMGSMIILLIVVMAFVAFRGFNRDAPESPVKAIDYTEGLTEIRSVANFPVLAPVSLPEGWIATSARFIGRQPQSWHLGVLNEERRYLGLEQVEGASVRSMVTEFVDDEYEERDPVGGWQAFAGADGDNGLVRQGEGYITLVMGRLPFDELASYASSLEE